MLYSSIMSGFVDEIELRKIFHSRRALRDSAESIDELVDSIGHEGLLQPIVVRPLGDKFEVVAGNRRFEACRKLRLRKVACHIIELDDREAFEVSLTENIQHKALDPVEEARAFKNYVDDLGYGGISELARRIHVSQGYITRRMQLLEMPSEVREQVAQGIIPPSTAQEIVCLEENAERVLAREIVKRGLSRNEVRCIVKELRQGYQITVEHHGSYDEKSRQIDRTISRCIALMKLSMSRLSDAIEDAEADFILREMLFEWRKKVSQQIDTLIKWRRKREIVEMQGVDI